MADVEYRGRTSGALYSFDIEHIPPTLLDEFGNVHTGEYNAELCIPSLRDGAVLNPQAMGVPNDGESIFNAYVHMPAWWSQDPTEQF